MGRPVVLHQQGAVFEQTAAAYFFRPPGRDQSFLKMAQRFGEVAEHRFAHNCGVKVLADRGRSDVPIRSSRASVEQQQRIQNNLEGIHAELELSTHAIDEFQFDSPSPLAPQRDQWPTVSRIWWIIHLQSRKLMLTDQKLLIVLISTKYCVDVR